MTQNRPEHRVPPSMPRWVKLFGIILIALVLAVIVMHLTGNNFGGFHHMP